MQSDQTLWEVLKSDVLIIGGGFGGLWAALRAAECSASVTLVDKSFAGKSGHSYFAGGAMMVRSWCRPQWKQGGMVTSSMTQASAASQPGRASRACSVCTHRP